MRASSVTADMAPLQMTLAAPRGIPGKSLCESQFPHLETGRMLLTLEGGMSNTQQVLILPLSLKATEQVKWQSA